MKKTIKSYATFLLGTAIMLGYSACNRSSDEKEKLSAPVTLKSSPLILTRDAGTSSPKVYGITLGASPDTVDISGSSVTTGTTSYDLIFFNEKASTDCSASATGLPAFLLCANTTGIYIGTGQTVYDLLTTSPTTSYSADPLISLPLTGSTYRCPDGSTLMRTPAQTLYNTGLMGNRFQNTGDDYSATYQNVYVLKVARSGEDVYYAFMIQKFKNGTSGTNAKKMTILYKELN